jgi:hypothetical protein
MNYFAVLFFACVTFFITTNPWLGGICNADHKPDFNNEKESFSCSTFFRRNCKFRLARETKVVINW